LGTKREKEFNGLINQVCRQAYREGRLPEMNERYGGSRAYRNPDKIISALKDEKHKIAAQLQKQAGLRVREAALIKKDQLGEGKILITKSGAKGGRESEVEVSKELYKEVMEVMAVIGVEGQFQIDQDQYREDIKDTYHELQEDYYGTHGFRWNYAQDKQMEYQEEGESFEQALSHVAEDMGHSRADISEHYLK